MNEYVIESRKIQSVPEQIGDALRGIMQEKHLSQAELSKILRRTPARMSQILNGKKGSNMEKLLPFLDELGYEIVIRRKNHW